MCFSKHWRKGPSISLLQIQTGWMLSQVDMIFHIWKFHHTDILRITRNCIIPDNFLFVFLSKIGLVIQLFLEDRCYKASKTPSDVSVVFQLPLLYWVCKTKVESTSTKPRSWHEICQSVIYFYCNSWLNTFYS